MKTRILGAVSALAILMATTAYTEANAGASADANTNTSVNARTETRTEAGADLKQVWQDTKETVSDAAETVGDKTKDAYQDIKAKLIEEDGDVSDFSVNARMTASGMIGQPVYNAANEKVGTVKDLILDEDGDAEIVVISDGGFMGIGDKLAAFDYDLVMGQEANGDVLMPLSEDAISKVMEFSYDEADAADNVLVAPSNGYSVAELLKGKLMDPKGATLGNIENVTFSDGEASQVIVAFDQTMGMGGERAALDFEDLSISKTGEGNLNFRMSKRQSASFEAYKNTRTN